MHAFSSAKVRLEMLTLLRHHVLGLRPGNDGKKQKTRPIDRLIAYRQCLPEGSVRRRIYELQIQRALKQARLPEEGEAVMEEIKKKKSHLESWYERESIKVDRFYTELERIYQKNVINRQFARRR